MQKTYFTKHRFCKLLLISAILTFSSYAKTDSGEDLLKFLVEQNEASHEKIKSYSYDLENEWKTENDFVFSGKAQVKKKGDCLWFKYNRTAFNETANKTDEIEIRLVVNDKYAALWPMAGSPIAYRYDFTSFDTMPSEIKTRIEVNKPFEIFDYCFGLKERAFSEMKKHPGAIIWDAVETKDSNNRTVYDVRRLVVNEDGSKKLRTKWVLDPEKGFLATEVINYQRLTNDILSHHLIQVEQVGNKIWFPVSYTEESYNRIRQPGETLTVRSWSKKKYKDIKVNEDFPEGQFEIEALNLEQDMPKITVLRRELDGSKVPYKYYEGKLLPEETIIRVKHAIESELDLPLAEQKETAISKSETLTQDEKPSDVTSVQKKNESPDQKSRAIQNEKDDQTAIIVILVILFVVLIVLTILIYRYRRK